MRGVVMPALGQIIVEERPDPVIEQPTDAVIRLAATCICGSDLWPYRGAETPPGPMGHDYIGTVETIGDAVTTVQPGDFVVGSFWASDNTCEICTAGYQSHCIHRTPMGTLGTQATHSRIPLADGTLVRSPGTPAPELIPSLMAAFDVLGTGWFAAGAAPRRTIAVVGDGAVGLMGVLAAHQLGAERIIVSSRHHDRQALAPAFGATDITGARGDDFTAALQDLTGGYGAHGTIEVVGTQAAMDQAIGATRPGGTVGFVGVSHDIAVAGDTLFGSFVALHGGPAPVRRFLPELIRLIWDGQIDPGRVFDLVMPIDQAAEGYATMDQRRAIKVLLTT